MALRLVAVSLFVISMIGCASTPRSTTVLTGPEGERWDAQALVGQCILGGQGSGWSRVIEVPCSEPGALRVLNVVNEHSDCHPDTIQTHLWPAQGPDPNVVVCAG